MLEFGKPFHNAPKALFESFTSILHMCATFHVTYLMRFILKNDYQASSYSYLVS